MAVPLPAPGTVAAQRLWHPINGAVLVALPVLVAVAGWLAGRSDLAALTGFIAMAAIAGYSVSGST